jgi:hypothetical protein
MPAVTRDLSQLNSAFIEWYSRHQASVDAASCPLSPDELLALVTLFESSVGASQFRRAALEQARASLARDPDKVSADPALLAQLNELRERLADEHRRDEERPRSARLDEAIAVLLERALSGDDLSRPAALDLAGKLFHERGRERVNEDDDLLAVGYYTAAWKHGGFRETPPSAFAAFVVANQPAHRVTPSDSWTLGLCVVGLAGVAGSRSSSRAPRRGESTRLPLETA